MLMFALPVFVVDAPSMGSRQEVPDVNIRDLCDVRLSISFPAQRASPKSLVGELRLDSFGTWTCLIPADLQPFAEFISLKWRSDDGRSGTCCGSRSTPDIATIPLAPHSFVGCRISLSPIDGPCYGDCSWEPGRYEFQAVMKVPTDIANGVEDLIAGTLVSDWVTVEVTR